MAFDGTDPCWVPRVPIVADTKQRLRIAQFGDGYEQRMLDGINSLELTWNLVWENKPEDDLLAMDAYLGSRNGAAFSFQHPVTLVVYSVFCDEWSISWNVRRPGRPPGPFPGPDFLGTMSAQFVKANGVAIGPITS